MQRRILDNYIFVYLEEDEVNTRLTSGCYVEKLNNNLLLLVWLDLNVENIKRMEISRFLQIFVDQPQCLMFETISCYNSNFPTDGFNSDYSYIDMERLVILVNAMSLKNPFPLSFTPKWQHFLCCCNVVI